MKSWNIALVAVAALGLTGCNDFSSPKAVVATAYDALQKENVKLFKRTLLGEAKVRYGSLEGMVALRKLLDGRKPTAGRVDLIKTDREGRHDKTRFYTVDVMGARGNEQPRRMIIASVQCDVSRMRRMPEPHIPGGGPVPPPSYFEEESEFCRIYDLN